MVAGGGPEAAAATTKRTIARHLNLNTSTDTFYYNCFYANSRWKKRSFSLTFPIGNTILSMSWSQCRPFLGRTRGLVARRSWRIKSKETRELAMQYRSQKVRNWFAFDWEDEWMICWSVGPSLWWVLSGIYRLLGRCTDQSNGEFKGRSIAGIVTCSASLSIIVN